MTVRKTDKWKRFERLIAALHAAEIKGAAITWNEKIHGRQFDVTVRFNDGLYDHLTVVECKDLATAVEVGEVDAFTTKSRDARADKAIIVSASGFQSGCMGVAERHGIGLFTLKEVDTIPAETLGSAFTPTFVRNIYDVALVLEGQTIIVLPQDRNRLPYLLRHSTIESGGATRSLEQVVAAAFGDPRVVSDREERELEIPFAHGSIATRPDERIAVRVAALRAKHRMRPAYAIKDGLDPYVYMRLNAAFEYTNALSGVTKRLAAPSFEIGFDTVMTPGKFYENRMGFYYYCDKIESGLIWLYLVESHQHGELLQTGEFGIEMEHARHYVEVTEDDEIARLSTMLARLKK